MIEQYISYASRKPILTFAPEQTAPRGDVLVVVFLRVAALHPIGSFLHKKRNIIQRNCGNAI